MPKTGHRGCRAKDDGTAVALGGDGAGVREGVVTGAMDGVTAVEPEEGAAVHERVLVGKRVRAMRACQEPVADGLGSAGAGAGSSQAVAE